MKNSQMIVLMGLLLALSVLVISSLAAEITNLNIVVTSERSSSLITEFICVRETFGEALNHNLVDNIDYDGVKLMFYGNINNIADAFSQTRDEFYTLELRHDNLFDAVINKQPWYSHKSDDGNYVYNIDVTISLANGNACITEDILYSIVCTHKISP